MRIRGIPLVMALITEFGNDFFTNYGLVNFSHFLPTFMEQDKIKPDYVAKPTWGREGREIEIIKGAGETVNNPDPEYTPARISCTS